MLTRLIALLVVLAGTCYPATTQIQDTLTTPTGALASGIITITNPAMTTAESVTLVRATTVVRIRDGLLDVSLEANDTATPAGTSYTVRYDMVDGTRWTEFWIVPTPPAAACASAPCTVAQVRQASATAAGLSILLSQLSVGACSEGQTLKVISGVLTCAADATGAGGLDCETETALTIATGAITLTNGSACYTVDTEGAASTDDVTQINCSTGTRFRLRAVNSARTVQVVHDGAAISIGETFIMDNSADVFGGRCSAANTVLEENRASNGN